MPDIKYCNKVAFVLCTSATDLRVAAIDASQGADLTLEKKLAFKRAADLLRLASEEE